MHLHAPTDAVQKSVVPKIMRRYDFEVVLERDKNFSAVRVANKKIRFRLVFACLPNIKIFKPRRAVGSRQQMFRVDLLQNINALEAAALLDTNKPPHYRAPLIEEQNVVPIEFDAPLLEKFRVQINEQIQRLLQLPVFKRRRTFGVDRIQIGIQRDKNIVGSNHFRVGQKFFKAHRREFVAAEIDLEDELLPQLTFVTRRRKIFVLDNRRDVPFVVRVVRVAFVDGCQKIIHVATFYQQRHVSEAFDAQTIFHAFGNVHII